MMQININASQAEAVDWCYQALFNDLNFSVLFQRVNKLIKSKKPQLMMAAVQVLSDLGFEGKVTPSKRQIQDNAIRLMRSEMSNLTRQQVLEHEETLNKLGFKLHVKPNRIGWSHISQCGGSVPYKVQKIQ